MISEPRRPPLPPVHPRSQRSVARGIGPGRADLERFVLPAKLDATTKRFLRLWRLPNLLQDIAFCRNPRLRTTVARWVFAKHRIELGPRFFALHQSQDRILCHELAHAATGTIHGRRVLPHGPEWRALVQAAGFSPQTRFTTRRPIRRLMPRAVISRHYEHRCPVCQAVRFGKRPAKRWRCIECTAIGLPGQLMIFEVPPRHVLS